MLPTALPMEGTRQLTSKTQIPVSGDRLIESRDHGIHVIFCRANVGRLDQASPPISILVGIEEFPGSPLQIRRCTPLLGRPQTTDQMPHSAVERSASACAGSQSRLAIARTGE
jgi:hypothetical protein